MYVVIMSHMEDSATRRVRPRLRSLAFKTSTINHIAQKMASAPVVGWTMRRNSRIGFIIYPLKTGGRGRGRTFDRSSISRLLYQLSYAPDIHTLLQTRFSCYTKTLELLRTFFHSRGARCVLHRRNIFLNSVTLEGFGIQMT